MTDESSLFSGNPFTELNVTNFPPFSEVFSNDADAVDANAEDSDAESEDEDNLSANTTIDLMVALQRVNIAVPADEIEWNFDDDEEAVGDPESRILAADGCAGAPPFPDPSVSPRDPFGRTPRRRRLLHTVAAAAAFESPAAASVDAASPAAVEHASPFSALRPAPSLTTTALALPPSLHGSHLATPELDRARALLMTPVVPPSAARLWRQQPPDHPEHLSDDVRGDKLAAGTTITLATSCTHADRAEVACAVAVATPDAAAAEANRETLLGSIQQSPRHALDLSDIFDGDGFAEEVEPDQGSSAEYESLLPPFQALESPVAPALADASHLSGNEQQLQHLSQSAWWWYDDDVARGEPSGAKKNLSAELELSIQGSERALL